MTLLEIAADACDKYAAPASCNTDNPPQIFTPPPVPAGVVDALATTGGDPGALLGYLIAGAFAVALGTLAAVLGLRHKQIKNQS